MQRLYCCVSEMTAEGLGFQDTKESTLMKHIRTASRAIEQEFGAFIPILETRKLKGNGKAKLLIPPLLSLTSISNDGIALTGSDYILEPAQRAWPDGPFWELQVKEDSVLAGAWSCEEEGVVIAGQWGLYSETEATGATVASQDNSSTSLVVDDGSKVSPGMVALIGSEMELVSATGAKSDSTANLSATAVTDSDDEITVTDGTKVKIGEITQVEFEKMRVLDISGNVLNVERGHQNTKRAAHLGGLDVYVFRTFTVERGANGTTAAAHDNAAVLRQVAPADVNWLCCQITGLLIKKAQTGFTGRSGNDDLGTGFWVNEFPRDPIEKTKQRYYVPIIR